MADSQMPDELRMLIRQLRPWLKDFGGQAASILAALVIVILAWSSWYTVQPEETAVVQRFGKFVRTTGPGLHFKFPFGIENVRLVPTARVLKEEFGFRTLSPGRRTLYSREDLSNESRTR